MNHYREKYSKTAFLVVSDDMKWCRKHLTASDNFLLGKRVNCHRRQKFNASILKYYINIEIISGTSFPLLGSNGCLLSFNHRLWQSALLKKIFYVLNYPTGPLKFIMIGFIHSSMETCSMVSMDTNIQTCRVIQCHTKSFVTVLNVKCF